MEKRFIVGVDLGTTNSAVTYIDLDKESIKNYKIKRFKIPQLVAQREFSALPVLPSFLYIPGSYDISADDIMIPWNVKQRNKEDINFVGTFARDQGAMVPNRLVFSAKSWLCNQYVDKRARILPWGSDNDVLKISPVQALTSYLKHIRNAWNLSQPNNEIMHLQNQTVVITVPASFDEVARDLTLESAKRAGLDNILLLEEPLAAFYSWLSKSEKNWSDYIKLNQVILICDVGGGTTDFTLVCLKKVEGKPRFERLAVGKHLILGGDNIDMVIAKKVAKKLYGKHNSISNNIWNSLCHQARYIKERILNGEVTSGKITIIGDGSSLISNTLSADISLKDIEDIVFDLFVPLDMSKTHRSNNNKQDLLKYGLPYEKNLSITNHLGDFLDKHQPEVEKNLGFKKKYPDAILFNGGSLKPRLIRERIISFLSKKFNRLEKEFAVIKNADIDSAVSIGATYYGLVKNGHGLKIGSGSSRSFYIGMQKKDFKNADSKSKKAMCIIERGLEEGSRISLPDNSFEVLANQPVSIDMYSSSFRSGDQCGDLVDIDDTLTPLPPIYTIIKFGEKGLNSKIPINIEATYTEVGALELWCKSLQTSHKWQLKFQLRNAKIQSDVGQNEVFDDTKIKAANNLIKNTFYQNDKIIPNLSITKEISNIVESNKHKWPLGMIRSLADTTLEYINVRDLSPDIESKWMNFVGFCLRPGLGEGFDTYRIKKIWKFYKQGPLHPNNLQVRLEWWIMWRRIAAGLSSGQQHQFIQDIIPILLDKKKYKKPKQEKIEIWMTSANMEGVNVKDKIRMGRQLLSEVTSKKVKPQLLWALSRLGARNLLYSSIDRVIEYKEISKWLVKIISTKWHNPKPVIEMVSLMSQKTGDQIRDIKPDLRSEIIKWINSFGKFTNQIEKINVVTKRDIDEQKVIFGESIPSGIIFNSKTL